MELTVQIDHAFAKQIDPKLIRAALAITLQRFCAASVTSASIVITDNRTMRQFNRAYRGVDTPTDVLAFDNIPDPDFSSGDRETNVHLGDIVIGFPVAEAQAQAAGHTPQQEVILLTVHGALHLVGFDHNTPESKHEMWQAQAQVLAELGLGHIQPTET